MFCRFSFTLATHERKKMGGEKNLLKEKKNKKAKQNTFKQTEMIENMCQSLNCSFKVNYRPPQNERPTKKKY